jgi:hypothetical protein
VEQVVPVGLCQLFPHDCRRESGRVGAGNQSAHAGSGHAVNRHAQPFEHFEHADMRRAARAAATEDQSDTRPGRKICGVGHCAQRKQDDQQQVPGNHGGHEATPFRLASRSDSG